MTEAYITHKEEVLAVYGEHLWPDQPEEDRRERMKGAFSALDNDGGINAWAKRFPSKNTLAGVKKRLKNGVIFNVSTYKKEQEDSTVAAMQRSERAIQYLGRLWEGKTKGASIERKKRTTLKSYLLQEAEATSREAKLRWGWENRIRIISLQHDGVVAIVQGNTQTEEVAKGMAAAASVECKFDVKVIPKYATILVT